jgi:hypothetical protein
MAYTEHEAQAASLKLALGADAPDVHDLVPFVKASDGDVAQAAAKVKESMAARKEYRKLTVKDVAEFYRAPAGGCTFPCGCMFPLEDMEGGIYRDNLGRPIVVSLGMQHGSAVEMQRQYGFVSELLEAHKRPNGPRGACIVIEIRPRDPSMPPSFRFPDRDVRTLFDMGRDVYPESLYSTTHFCGLPRAVTWAFKLVRPFMRREAYAAMVLKPSFAHLGAVMPRESMLQQWGGELAFDLDEWLEWRAKEEGVPTGELCPRNQGRAFDPAATAAASGDAMEDSLRANSIGARALLSGEVGASGTPPRLHGAVDKRGSGRGMFGNVRWKSKLLAVCDIGLVYFDGLDESDQNKAARIVPLGEPGTTVARRPSERARPHQFAVVCATREYLFAVPSEEAAAKWVGALEVEIDAAQKTRLEMLGDGGVEVGAMASTLEALSIADVL